MDKYYKNQLGYQGCDDAEFKFIHIWNGNLSRRKECNSTISVDSLENYKSKRPKRRNSELDKRQPSLVQTSIQSNFSKRRKDETREIEQVITDAISIIPGPSKVCSDYSEITSNEEPQSGPDFEEKSDNEIDLKAKTSQEIFESTYSFIETEAELHNVEPNNSNFLGEFPNCSKQQDNSFDILNGFSPTNPFAEKSELEGKSNDVSLTAIEMDEQIETRRRKEAVTFLPDGVEEIEQLINDEVPQITFSSEKRRRSSVRTTDMPLFNHQDPAGMDMLKSSIARNHFFKKFRIVYIIAITLIIIGLLVTIAGAFAVRLTVPENVRLKFDKQDSFQPFIRHKELRKYEPEISTGNWVLLRIVFSFRYFGPFIMGVALFTVAMMLLHNFWVTDRDVKRLNSFLFSDDFQSYPIYFNSVLRKWGYLASKFEGQLRDERARKISFKTTKLL